MSPLTTALFICWIVLMITTLLYMMFAAIYASAAERTETRIERFRESTYMLRVFAVVDSIMLILAILSRTL